LEFSSNPPFKQFQALSLAGSRSVRLCRGQQVLNQIYEFIWNGVRVSALAARRLFKGMQQSFGKDLGAGKYIF